MQSHSRSISDRAAFRLALFAFGFVWMVLLSGNAPARQAGTDWLTRHHDDRVEQIAAPNDAATPMGTLDIRSSDRLPEEVVELAESTDEDETKHCIVEVLRFDVTPFGNKPGLFESSAERAPTPFRLRAFSNRGSPSV